MYAVYTSYTTLQYYEMGWTEGDRISIDVTLITPVAASSAWLGPLQGRDEMIIIDRARARPPPGANANLSGRRPSAQISFFFFLLFCSSLFFPFTTVLVGPPVGRCVERSSSLGSVDYATYAWCAGAWCMV